jgi:hypothetical protein
MLQMLGVFAEFERTTIVERVTAGMERAASQGRWVMGKVPFGYIRDEHSKTILAEPVQAVVVRRTFELYATGRKGTKAIAHILNAEGFRTKNGMPFAHPIVHSILCNPIYAGRVRFRGQEFSGLHDGLVDEEMHGRAQALMAERGESHALRRGNATPTICYPEWCAVGSVGAHSSEPRPKAGARSTTTTRAQPAIAMASRSAVRSGCRELHSKRQCSSRWSRYTATAS